MRFIEPSLCFVLPAPVVAALTKFFSCRLLSCCGSFLCFLGFFVASTSQSLPVIVFCTGVLPGRRLVKTGSAILLSSSKFTKFDMIMHAKT